VTIRDGLSGNGSGLESVGRACMQQSSAPNRAALRSTLTAPGGLNLRCDRPGLQAASVNRHQAPSGEQRVIGIGQAWYDSQRRTAPHDGLGCARRARGGRCRQNPCADSKGQR